MDTLKVNFLGARHLVEALLPSMPSGSAVACVASNAGLGWQLELEKLLPVVTSAAFAEGASRGSRPTPTTSTPTWATCTRRSS